MASNSATSLFNHYITKYKDYSMIFKLPKLLKLPKMFKKQTLTDILENDLATTKSQLILASKHLIEARAMVELGKALTSDVAKNIESLCKDALPLVHSDIASEKQYHELRQEAQLKLLTDMVDFEVKEANFHMLCTRYIRLSKAVKNGS